MTKFATNSRFFSTWSDRKKMSSFYQYVPFVRFRCHDIEQLWFTSFCGILARFYEISLSIGKDNTDDYGLLWVHKYWWRRCKNKRSESHYSPDVRHACSYDTRTNQSDVWKRGMSCGKKMKGIFCRSLIHAVSCDPIVGVKRSKSIRRTWLEKWHRNDWSRS